MHFHCGNHNLTVPSVFQIWAGKTKILKFNLEDLGISKGHLRKHWLYYVICNLYFQALHGHHQVVIPTVEMHQLHPSLDPNTTGYILVQQAETVSLPVTHHHHQGVIKSENNDPESIDEFLRATNIEDFLWYNCPKCDFKVSNSTGPGCPGANIYVSICSDR